MAIKITMLKERFVPVLNVVGKVGEVLKVNNEVGHELVKEGDAEYLDSELMDEFKKKWSGSKVSASKMETAAIDPNENEIIPKGEFKTPGKWSGMKKKPRK